jgi:ribosomal protein L11 methyltransferase
MDKFWMITLFHYQPDGATRQAIEKSAFDQYGATGIEEFSLDEPQVDALLGDRSYSGGDLPQAVLDEVEEKILAAPSNYRFFFDQRDNATNFLHFCRNKVLAEAQLEELDVQDWNAEWRKHYSPIMINEFFEVIPSWMTNYKSSAARSIFIYPGMGFGTGSHETTHLCLKLFTEELQSMDLKDVLDFGSGSGILGLSILKFKPLANVDFYDIDQEANKNCYENALINNLQGSNFRLLLPMVRERLLPRYDLVFANILESILLQERDFLVSSTKVNGHLILSGLLKQQVPNIISEYQSAGLKLIKQADKGDWAALLFLKD